MSKTSLETTDQTTTELLNTYSDDDYIKKIQKRLEEDAFAREQREKRRRRLLMDQLMAHEAQEVSCSMLALWALPRNSEYVVALCWYKQVCL